ncbi:MAG: LysR family transcriptional regulator [Oscillospiraceae bacterium]|nr:LysR family transcriptional regulator [Oscillospiraceae bacterium]
MELKNMRTFLYVAELGSFTKAAARLGFSQSTVSFQIKQLEDELQVRLFERIRHTVKLTEQGREVLRYAHEMDKLMEEMRSVLREESMPAGHVRLAMADSLCMLLGDSLHSFYRAHPGISLQIITAGTGEMFRLLDHNEVDLVFTLDNHIYNSRYLPVKEERVAVHFVAQSGHPLAKRRRVPAEELTGLPFLLTEKDMSYRRLLDEQLSLRSLELEPILEMGSTQTLCRLVEQGAGISFLPDYVTEASTRAGRLVRFSAEEFEISVWKQLFCHRDKWVSPQLRCVMEYLAGI